MMEIVLYTIKLGLTKNNSQAHLGKYFSPLLLGRGSSVELSWWETRILSPLFISQT